MDGKIFDVNVGAFQKAWKKRDFFSFLELIFLPDPDYLSYYFDCICFLDY